MMVGPVKNFPNRVYVIDPNNPNGGTDRPASTKSVNKGEDGKELPEYLQSSKKTRQKRKKTPRAKTGTQTRTQKKTQPQKQTRAGNSTPSRKKAGQSDFPLAFIYFAGPLSILATSRGRESRLWVGLSISSVVLGIIAMCIWMGHMDWSTQKSPGGAVILIMAMAAVVSGFLAWTRAIVLAGQYEGSRLKHTPDWIRGPLAAGLFGMIFPGMGLFVNGRSKQAAAALWMACLTIISLLFLSRGLWMWNFNLQAGVFAVRPDFLERILIFSSVTAVLGCLVWIVQALNGVRLASRSSGRKTVYRSNWAAVALLVSIIAFTAFSRPAEVAEALDIGAAIAKGEGMKIIPLQLSLAAIRFDPSHPGYFIRAIGLYEDCGDRLAAEDMRRELIDRLKPSVPLLEKEGILVAGSRISNGTTADSPALADVRLDNAPIDVILDSDPELRAMSAELLTLDWSMSRVKP